MIRAETLTLPGKKPTRKAASVYWTKMLHISAEEHRDRLVKLGASIARAGLDLFIVSSFDSIYYLAGAGFEPLERPFFLLVYPLNARAPLLLVPKLEEEHMRKAHIPGLKDRLEEGPHVALVATRVNGYAAECERTYFTVLPDREIRRAFDAMFEARRRAFTLVRPGISCSDLDEEVHEYLRSEGYGSEDQRLHRTGHGVGLGNHEAPWIAEGSTDVLTENMVISIEPGIYLKGKGGVRHSDTVLVTRDGYELLTSFPDDLKSLTIKGWKLLTRLKGAYVRWALRVEKKQGNLPEPAPG